MEYSEKQVQIMEAAEALFAERGFSGTSVRDIAEAANVNLAMISYYFGSKEKLMEAMFSYRGHHLKLQLQNLLQDESMNSMQKVEKLIDDYIDRIFKKQSFHKVMIREQMTDKDGPIARQIFQLKQSNQALIKQLIQQGQKKGEFKKQVDVPFLMMTLVGTTSQLVTAQHFYKEINNLQEMPDQEFEKHIKKKLSAYLKTLYKAILDYEA
ncbi:MAG TPA: TetR family transcriptional regulator [Flavisolibacter sp.]|jgi:AcrR family transcriptional regulator|nr:TetR family transcriptional regulator [Flavisolibacter sp.]